MNFRTSGSGCLVWVETLGMCGVGFGGFLYAPTGPVAGKLRILLPSLVD